MLCNGRESNSSACNILNSGRILKYSLFHSIYIYLLDQEHLNVTMNSVLPFLTNMSHIASGGRKCQLRGRKLQTVQQKTLPASRHDRKTTTHLRLEFFSSQQLSPSIRGRIRLPTVARRTSCQQVTALQYYRSGSTFSGHVKRALIDRDRCHTAPRTKLFRNKIPLTDEGSQHAKRLRRYAASTSLSSVTTSEQGASFLDL